MIRFTGFLFALLILSKLNVMGQGIQFESTSLEEVLEKAQKEDKLVFIDFYTTWCGPCKSLEKFVFTDEKVGKLYNQEFINIKLDAEKAGAPAAKKYGVRAYPSLVFVNGAGEIVYKKVGGLNVNSMIELGEKVLREVQGGYSIATLKKQYPSKKHDEYFLRIYIEKMLAASEKPYEAVEEWFNIQTQVKENDVDMMEFLLKHNSLFLIGSKAEQILDENYDEYWSIATKKEERGLKSMKAKIIDNTKELAYKKQDPKLFRSFIDRWKTLPGSKGQRDNLINYELEYLLLTRDYVTFKEMAAQYLDSIVSAKTLEQIRSEDQAFYKKYKETEYAPSIIGDVRLKRAEQGRQAGALTKTIHKVAVYYLRHCNTEEEYKQLLSWLDYAAQLLPEDHTIDNFRSAVYQKKGEPAKAILYKEAALNKTTENSQDQLKLQKELNQMKKKLQ